MAQTEVDKPIKLKQSLGLINGVSMVVGTIVGSGIFLSPSEIINQVGSPALSLIIWFVSGIISMIGALCYAEIGTTIVKSGASYAYILEGFGPMFGFVRVWLSVLIIEPTVQAAIAITFAKYLIKVFFPTCQPPLVAERLIAGICSLFICYINCVSVKWAARIQDWFSYAKFAALLVITSVGFYIWATQGTSIGSLGDPWKDSKPGIDNIAVALYMGLYSFAGFDTLNFMTEELKDPYKNLPLAIYISMPIVIVCYLLVNVAYLFVLTTEEMTSSEAIALTFASKTMGRGDFIMSLFVAMSTFGALNSSFYASSRLFYTAARQEQLPSYFGMVHPKYKTPIPALCLTTGLSLMYLCVPNVFDLIGYYSFMYWLTIGLAIVSLVYLRFKQPNRERPIKYPLALSIGFCCICLYLVVITFVIALKDSLIGSALLLTGFPLYLIFIYKKGKFTPKFLVNVVEFVTIFMQKSTYVVPETKCD